MLYKIIYSDLAWKNMISFVESDTESEALEELLKFENYDDNLKVIAIEKTERN